jgi:hypothetical protein
MKETRTRHLQLRLVVRHETDNNLFVRLSPKVARELRSLALHADEDETQADGRCWKIQDDEDESLGFLPLSISILDHNIYASYNGGSLNEQGKPSNDTIAARGERHIQLGR